MEHTKHLTRQPLPQDVLNIDLKPEEMVGPGPRCGGKGCGQASWPWGEWGAGTRGCGVRHHSQPGPCMGTIKVEMRRCTGALPGPGLSWGWR